MKAERRESSGGVISIGSWLMGMVLALGVAISGCGSGDLLAPYEINPSWDRIEYMSLNAPDTLRIDKSGAICFLEMDEGARSGLLGPATWRALEAALSRAEMEPGVTESAGHAAAPNQGAFYLTRDGDLQGFMWSSEDSLAPGQMQLVNLLEGVREEVLGPDPSERVDLIPAGRLLHGYDARAGETGEFLSRDEDALFDLLRRQLDRETVVLPKVDFESEMVLAIFLGPRSRERFDLEIDESVIRTADGYLQVSVTLYTRAEGCPVPEGTGGAFDIVRLPRLSSEVFFLWDQVETSCTRP